MNDTVTFDPKTDPDVGEFFSRLPDADYLPTWYQQRVNGGKGQDEKAAADKAAKHADTPTVAHFDTMGRTFLSVADNGKDASSNDQKFRTRTVLDIEGNQREVIDALERIVMRYDYDMLGTRIHQASMEAGERWMLNDVTGKPIRAWNSRKYAFRTEYDALHRPLKSFVQGGDPTEAHPKVLPQEILCERTIYGDSTDTGLTDLQQRQANLRGKAYKHFDGAGIVTTDQYDFKGNPLRNSRQFAVDYKNAPDWSQAPAVEVETFRSSTAYDALNRPSAITAPDQSIYRPTFNEASLLDKVDVNLRGAASATAFVTNIDYNAKGQRTLIAYGNGAQTSYEYDPQTFRLTHLKTTRTPPAPGLGARIRNALGVGSQDIGSQIFKDAATLQDLRYVYDPVGNITRIADAALQTTFSNNQQVDAACDYHYDALYRLIQATGREHSGQSKFQFAPPDGNYRDYPFVGIGQLNDLQALRNYTEQFQYDPVGNFEKMQHQAGNGGWTRSYTYAEPSLIEPTKKSNRLSQTALQTSPAAPVEPYLYDAHGNMTQMPHLPVMQWDFKNQMCASARQVVNAGMPETTLYVYDAGGQRARKVTERQNGTRKNERLYVGGFEVYRDYDGSGANVTLARETLHVMNDKQRIALLETQTVSKGNPIDFPRTVQRYQLGNHLDSVSLELDEIAGLVSYEEYLPYGSTAYQAGRSAAETSLKRYRYTEKERDGETGFSYHGARYCAPWLGRWTSCDPKPPEAGRYLYVYCNDLPIRLIDQNGAAPFDPQAGNWFTKLLLYRNDTPVLDAITNDRNLKAAQDFVAAATVGAEVAIATGGAATALGATTLEAGLLGGAEGGLAQTHTSAALQGRQATVKEQLEGAAVGATTGGGFALAETKLIPAVVRATTPKPSVPAEPAPPVTQAEPTVTQTPAQSTSPGITPNPKGGAAPEQPSFPKPTPKPAPQPPSQRQSSSSTSPSNGTQDEVQNVTSGAPRADTHPGLRFHYTDVENPTEAFSQGIRSQSSFTGEGNLSPKAAATRLGVPRPRYVIVVRDIGQFQASTPTKPVPTRGISGGGSEYVNPKPIPLNQVEGIYEVDRNGPIWSNNLLAPRNQ